MVYKYLYSASLEKHMSVYMDNVKIQERNDAKQLLENRIVREAELMNLSQNEIVNKLDQFKQLEENRMDNSIPNRMDNSIPPLNTIYIPNSPYNTPSFTPNATPTSTKSEPILKLNNKAVTLSEVENGLRNLKRTPPNIKKEIPVSQFQKELLEKKNKKENPIIPPTEIIEEKIPVNKYEDFHRTTVTQLSKIYSQLTKETYSNSGTKAEILNKLDNYRQQNKINIDKFIEDMQKMIASNLEANKLAAANKLEATAIKKNNKKSK